MKSPLDDNPRERAQFAPVFTERDPSRRRRSKQPAPPRPSRLPQIVGGVAGIAIMVAVVVVLVIVFGRGKVSPKPDEAATADRESHQTSSLPQGTLRRKMVTRDKLHPDEMPATGLLLAIQAPAKTAITSLDPSSSELIEAADVLARYQAAHTWREKLPLVLRHDLTSEILRDFYETRAAKDPHCGPAPVGGAVMSAGDLRVIVACFPTEDRLDGVALAFFHRVAGGGLRLDWDSFVGLSDVSWKDMRASRSVEPTLLRGFLTLDDYHNFEFADAKQWLSLRLRSPDGTDMLNAYCLRQSSAAAFLRGALHGVPDSRNLLAPPPPDQMPVQNLPVTVAVRYPPQAQSDQCVELLEIVPGRWLLFDDETALTVEKFKESMQMINNLRRFSLGNQRDDIK